jgi:hypothetical protein
MAGVESGVTNSELRLRVQRERAASSLTFPATQTVWLGRDQTCEVVLDSQEVSRRHLSLFVRDGELWVRDHSSYGSHVNGQPLQRAVRSVDAPALIQLGPYRVEVTLAAGVLAVRLLSAAPLLRVLSGARARLAVGGLMLCFACWLSQRFWPAPSSVLPSAAATQTPCPPAPKASAAEHAASPLRAVQLLRAGDRLSALHAYRALAALDDSRAEFSIVAELLARELSCQL